MASDLYEKIRRKFHMPTRQEAKNMVFGFLYGPQESQPDWLKEMINEHHHETETRDHGGESG